LKGMDNYQRRYASSLQATTTTMRDDALINVDAR
jgi:hypothetical protein